MERRLTGMIAAAAVLIVLFIIWDIFRPAPHRATEPGADGPLRIAEPQPRDEGIALDFQRWRNYSVVQRPMDSDFATQKPKDAGTAPEVDRCQADRAMEMEWREYLFFREELRHEDNLINQRVSWLISSQAFLLGGFATLIGAGPNTLAGSLGGLKNAMLLGLPIAGILGVLTNGKGK